MKKVTAIVLLALLVVTFSMTKGQKADEYLFPILSSKIDDVKKLIDAGVDVNGRFDIGASRNITPLYVAVMAGQADIGKLLIDFGADVNIKFEGANLLHVAALYGGNKAVVELLIAKGLDVNEKCSAHGIVKDMTPLHAAAGKDNVEVAEALLENGAELDAKVFQNHYTSLHVAARNNKKGVAELLIARGAEVNARTKYGETPLDLATSKGHKELGDLLRKHGGISGKK